MKPVVVIHIDSLRREYVTNWLLGQAFKRAGYQVILTSRISTPYLLRVFKPDILILSHVFALSAPALEKLSRNNVKIYINEVEGVISDEAGISSTYPAGTIDYELITGIFVWSDWSRDWLIKNRHLSSDRVHTTGSIRNSALVSRQATSGTHAVGILSRFELINTFDGRHAFENLSVIDPEDQSISWYYDRWAIDAEAFSIVSKITGILTARGIRVSLRPHPNENLSSYRLLEKKFGPLFTVDRSYDINEWLSTISVVVGPTSTAYTEAYLAGIPVISTQGIQRFQYTAADRIRIINEFARASYMPHTVEDAVALCEKVSLTPVNSPALNDYFDNFYSLAKQPDPIGKIVEIVVASEDGEFPERGGMRWSGALLKYVVDVAAFCRACLQRHPLKSLRNMRQYDFCSVLHRPNSYMKRLEEEKNI